jgi:hypothetical protein
MKFSRRDILKIGLGASQVALLSSLGLPTRRAWAGGHYPDKLLTLYFAGGWMPSYFWWPGTDDEILRLIPEPTTFSSPEIAFFRPEHVISLDGSGDRVDPEDERYQRLRVIKHWDADALGRGENVHTRSNPPHGWSWVEYGLHEDVCVVHGVDMGTASHQSGRISAMCGAPGSRYRAPAMHAVVANALHAEFGDTRPLGAVAIGTAPLPAAVGLPAHAAPTLLGDLGSLEYTLSERNDRAWSGLRGRNLRVGVDYRGQVLPMPIVANEMDAQVLRRIARLRGTTNVGTDAFYEGLYQMYAGTSNQLARDVVSIIEATPGWENLPRPHWIAGPRWGPFGVSIGPGTISDSGHWEDSFNLSLKLLKSGLTSAVSVDCRGLGNWYFDSHGDGHRTQFAQVRATLDVAGRLIGEMKNTPGDRGGSLLDETLVIMFSEFARTWPGSSRCDHWPITSVAFAGGGVKPNRMIGNFDFTDLADTVNGPNGAPVDLLDEGGDPQFRPPRSADIVHTAYRVMGIEDFFIPGGSGEILGVRE